MTQDPHYWTKEQVAQQFQVTTKTVDRWVLDGTIPSMAIFKVSGGTIRFDSSAIRTLAENQSVAKGDE